MNEGLTAEEIVKLIGDPWGLQSCRWCKQGYELIQSSVSEYRVHPDSPVGRVLCGIQDNALPMLPGIAASRLQPEEADRG